jgi:hypothetical protein
MRRSNEAAGVHGLLAGAAVARYGDDGRTSEVAMRILSLMTCLLFIAAPAFGQSMTDTEQELLKIRAKMSQNFVDAVATKDVSLVADHYTKDAVIAGLAPTKWTGLARLRS